MGWIQLAILVVGLIVSYASRSKPQTPRPATLEDFTFPTAQEGRAVIEIFGEEDIESPNVLWYGDLRPMPIKSSGKK